jgi:hypothetical protein
VRASIRVLVVAVVALVVAGAVVLYTVMREPPADSPPEAVQLYPAPQQWAGVLWTRIDQSDLNERGVGIFGAASYGSWIAAWGESPLADAAEGVKPVLWTSNGGLAWQRHEVRLVTGQRIWPQKLAIGPAGHLLFALRDPEDNVGLVAASKDAEHWVEVGRPPIEPRGPLAATATGFVTVGVNAGEPLVLTTSDGAAWEKVAVPARAGEYLLADVRQTADGFVVSGRIEPADDWDAVLWRSGAGGVVEDLGANPVFASPDRSVGLSRTVPFSGGIFATGSAGNAAECALMGGLVASLAPIIADTCPGPPPMAWGSRDGHRWQEVLWPRRAGQPDQMPTMHVMTAGAAGVVALVDERPPGAEKDVVGLWTSADGVEWSRIGNGMPLGAGGLNEAMVGLPGRLIVFAWTGTGTAVWVGTPGG